MLLLYAQKFSKTCRNDHLNNVIFGAFDMSFEPVFYAAALVQAESHTRALQVPTSV